MGTRQLTRYSSCGLRSLANHAQRVHCLLPDRRRNDLTLYLKTRENEHMDKRIRVLVFLIPILRVKLLLLLCLTGAGCLLSGAH